MGNCNLQGDVLVDICAFTCLQHLSLQAATFTCVNSLRHLALASILPNSLCSCSFPVDELPIPTSTMPVMPFSLLTLDMSLTAAPADTVAAVVTAHTSLVALRLSVSTCSLDALAAAAALPRLQHLDLNHCCAAHALPLPIPLPLAACAALANMLSKALAACSHRSLAERAAITDDVGSAAADVPWWGPSEGRPSSVPHAPFHLVVDVALVAPDRHGSWLQGPHPLVPLPTGYALTLRHAGTPAADAALEAVAPSVRDRFSPGSTTVVHLVLRHAAAFVGTGGHLELLGVDITDVLVRQLIGADVPLDSLRLSCRPRRASLVTEAAPLAVGGCLMGYAWKRRVVPCVWRQLVDSQARHPLRVLHLCGLQGTHSVPM
jgi:hypothetical protein